MPLADPVSKILVILADSPHDLDQRAKVLSELCKSFAEECSTRGITIDILELYKDKEFNVQNLDLKDPKVVEYQIRIKKAQMIAFFHPVWWDSPPSVLKGFLDKVLTPGFAYKIERRVANGLLKEKQCLVVAVGEKPHWHMRFINRNLLYNFWKRSVGDTVGFKTTFAYFGSLRSVDTQTITQWHQKVRGMAQRINSKESIFDLF